jgi:gamma-glutamylcyclotransferase (GGCT)/AIG2-like uncharacterized protein YtfP
MLNKLNNDNEMKQRWSDNCNSVRVQNFTVESSTNGFSYQFFQDEGVFTFLSPGNKKIYGKIYYSKFREYIEALNPKRLEKNQLEFKNLSFDKLLKRYNELNDTDQVKPSELRDTAEKITNVDDIID